jgi:phage terminase Nu1 subunit (DNA packaging protein)
MIETAMAKPGRPRKTPDIDVPKIASGQGGARPGAGRKTELELTDDVYRLYNVARAKKMKHESRLAEFEEKQKSGELIEVEVVRVEWQQILANVRAKLLALPSKLAAQTFGAASVAEVQGLLQAGVHEVLQEIASDAE